MSLLAPFKHTLRNRARLFAGLAGLAPLVLVASAPDAAGPYSLAGLAVAGAIAFLLPRYLRLVAAVEDRINQRTGYVTPCRLLMPLLLAPLAALLVALFSWRPHSDVANLNAALALGSLCGLYSVALVLAVFGIGDRIRNSLLAAALGVWLIVLGLEVPAVAGTWGIATLPFMAHLLVGLASDGRAHFYPKAGVAVFFGTFNPVHLGHLRLMRTALATRRLSKIYIHATTVPKLHRSALANGELSLSFSDGMRAYAKTDRADPFKNYFPTGNRFYEYEVRRELLAAAIEDAGLTRQVEVLNLPETYLEQGFHGIVAHVKRLNPDVPLHGIHGSDPGGMWVRTIFDYSGWLYPCPFVRSDTISATAIRDGAIGLTSATVEAFLAASRSGRDFTFPSGFVVANASNPAPREPLHDVRAPRHYAHSS